MKSTIYKVNWISPRGRGEFDAVFDAPLTIIDKLDLRARASEKSKLLHTDIEKEFPASVVQSHDSISSISICRGESYDDGKEDV